jgi:hypothetical protein
MRQNEHRNDDFFGKISKLTVRSALCNLIRDSPYRPVPDEKIPRTPHTVLPESSAPVVTLFITHPFVVPVAIQVHSVAARSRSRAIHAPISMLRVLVCPCEIIAVRIENGQ